MEEFHENTGEPGAARDNNESEPEESYTDEEDGSEPEDLARSGSDPHLDHH